MSAIMNVDLSVPEWARFIAQDARGQWWWYERRPKPIEGEWRLVRKTDNDWDWGRLAMAYSGFPPADYSRELWEVMQ